ncbi:basal body-orientation factor 1-like isoform X1 [Triplophysa dalaica]|uniref:basal body-orientation factor 1-like isoform X1 n=1 Tax=Triplophysa dalaica TaxID=1582913 RepID=UPI0024DF59CA|nr:basal body-orientation factor 1-like isoform X1 [Triplophysa dalaica]
MPIKKGKKGKGKGKKDGKQESKRDKESDIERAKANAALWEARCDMTETSRIEYHETAGRLAKANEHLTDLQHKTEKKTIDIIAVLREKDVENEEKIAALEQRIQIEKTRSSQEKDSLITDFTLRIGKLEEKFEKRSSEFRIIQEELRIINDFLEKKPQMEQELRNMKESLDNADLDHQKTLKRMEQKFLNDKFHLEQEAEQNIAVLAEKAHNEAIVQLDVASRSVFKENVRLNKALSYHIKEVEDLRKRNAALPEKNDNLTQQKETSQLIMNDTVSQITTQRSQITEMKVKVSTLERALASTVAEFECEKVSVKHRAKVRTQASGVELGKLQKLLTLRERELSRVKKLARSIVEQRTDTEILFHEALNQVKQEILTQRLEGEVTRSKRMNEVLSGRRDYAHIQNSVSTGSQEVETGNLRKHRTDISEMRWEQRERVLRLLFAKMNSKKSKKPIDAPALADFEGNPCSSDPSSEESSVTFLTQAEDFNMGSTAVSSDT